MTSSQNDTTPVPSGGGRRAALTTVCPNPSCGKEFRPAGGPQRRAVAEGKRPYCSRDCQRAAHRVTLPCVGCGAEVERTTEQRRKATTEAVYCGDECRRKVGSKPKTGQMVACANGCGTEVWRKPSEIATRAATYCSPECRAESQQDRVTWPCEACDTEVETVRSKMGRYCSSKCAASGRRRQPGDTYTSPKGYVWVWGEDGVKRQQHTVVMERMIGRPLERHENVHHKNGQRGDNAESNLEIWSTAQPAGQRPEDKVAFALEMLALYGYPGKTFSIFESADGGHSIAGHGPMAGVHITGTSEADALERLAETMHRPVSHSTA